MLNEKNAVECGVGGGRCALTDERLSARATTTLVQRRGRSGSWFGARARCVRHVGWTIHAGVRFRSMQFHHAARSRYTVGYSTDLSDGFCFRDYAASVNKPAGERRALLVHQRRQRQDQVRQFPHRT